MAAKDKERYQGEMGKYKEPAEEEESESSDEEAEESEEESD